MQTILQNDDRAFESHVAHPGEYAASTSANWYNFSSNNIPYLPKQSKGNQYNSTTKKRIILTKRVYSTRTRGRSGPLQSLARKLGRFKVRIQEIAYNSTTKKRVILTKRVYSTRTRGRSGPLQSLARKLGRFKVRIQEIASEESNQNR